MWWHGLGATMGRGGGGGDCEGVEEKEDHGGILVPNGIDPNFVNIGVTYFEE